MNTPGCTAIVEMGGVPDEYGSGYRLCWQPVGRTVDGEGHTDGLLCLQGHTHVEMIEGARKSGRPNAESFASRLAEKFPLQ